MKKYISEMIGTMVLVLMGCGSAIFNGGCGTTAQVLTVAFAFGLSVVAMAYAISEISGCHINPAITLGCWLSGRMKGGEAVMYMVFQVIGALIGSSILYLLVQGYAVDPAGTLTGANFICREYFHADRLFSGSYFHFHFCAGCSRRNGRRKRNPCHVRVDYRPDTCPGAHRMYPDYRYVC